MLLAAAKYSFAHYKNARVSESFLCRRSLARSTVFYRHCPGDSWRPLCVAQCGNFAGKRCCSSFQQIAQHVAELCDVDALTRRPTQFHRSSGYRGNFTGLEAEGIDHGETLVIQVVSSHGVFRRGKQTISRPGELEDSPILPLFTQESLRQVTSG